MTVSSSKSQNRLRIIGGEWRSRVLHFPDVPGLRPTPDRVRETLFNWLQPHIYAARCLDLFAGSGALGFEALSRGAAKVTALELDTGAIKALTRNCNQLGTGKVELIQQDAMVWLAETHTCQYDLVFIDPPFASALQEQCCHLLEKRGWLAEGALVYLEAALPLEKFVFPQGWELLKSKKAGDVHYGLCRNSQSSL